MKSVTEPVSPRAEIENSEWLIIETDGLTCSRGKQTCDTMEKALRQETTGCLGSIFTL